MTHELDQTEINALLETLDQSEIDALMQVRAAMGEEGAPVNLNLLDQITGDGSEGQVLAYDFKRPRLFSLDRARVLQYVHESFARDLSVYLSAQLRTMVEISLTAVEQMLYSEYTASSTAPSALYIGEARGLQHQLIFELDPRFAVYMIEKLFGGQGIFPDTPREPSQIEQRITARVVRRAFDELEAAWERVHEIELYETAFESNADFVQILPSMEPVLVGNFELTVQGHTSFINICYPYLLLERMLGRTGMQRWMSSTVTTVPPEIRNRYESTLRTMDIELRAELGRTQLSLQDLAGLQVGDVIPLRRGVEEPIQVFIGKQEKFKAAIGRAGRQRALRILDDIESTSATLTS